MTPREQAIMAINDTTADYQDACCVDWKEFGEHVMQRIEKSGLVVREAVLSALTCFDCGIELSKAGDWCTSSFVKDKVILRCPTCSKKDHEKAWAHLKPKG